MAVQGLCLTIGLELLLATDIRVAALERLLPDLVPLMGSEDVKEGIESFIERRTARFKGR